MKTKTATLLENKFQLHCPKCDNIWNFLWVDGDVVVGNGVFRCPECLHEFVPTAKMFKTAPEEHGKRVGKHYAYTESLNAKARREAR